VFITIVLFTVAFVVYLAFRDWLQAPHLSPKSIQKSLNSASRYISLKEWDKAKNELQPLIKKGKGGRQSLLLHAQVLQGTHHLEQALKIVIEAAHTYPEDLLFRLEEGKIFLKLGRAKEALEAFNVCSPIMRGESDGFVLASALFHANYPLHCLELIEEWLKTTQNGELIALGGDAHFEQKNFREAIANYNQAIQLGFKTHRIFIQLGHAYRRLGNLAEGEKIFRGLLEKDSTDVTATLGVGSCLQERGYYHKALLFYQSGRAWEKKDPLLLIQAAVCSLRAKRYPLAERYLWQVIQNEEKRNPQILSYYGYSLESQKKWQEAEQVYLKLIQSFSSSPEGYRALAWLFGVGLTTTLSHKQGIDYAHIALKLKADMVSWEILSACEARIGNFSRAHQIQTSLASNDKDPQSKTRRQAALRKLRKRHPLDNNHVSRALVA